MPDDEERFMGYTLLEAASAAVENGSLGAWDWFQAWFNAELGPEDPFLEDW